MKKSYRVVKLLKNRLYPTYQLYGVMNNRKTSPQDGLRLGALTTLDWLKSRLGPDGLSGELSEIPDSARYKEVTDDCLTSFHISSGFVIDVVSLPDKGLWTLQITEPDLGSDPGNPQQARPAVPGRVIETNIGFCIAGQALECGFQTLISDPVGTAVPAEVYRLSPVRRLLEHPAFGLRQVVPLENRLCTVQTQAQLKTLLSVWRSGDNQMPSVVFTQVHEEEPPARLAEPGFGVSSARLPGLLPLPHTETVTAKDPPYDMAAFSVRGAGFCRTYLLPDRMRRQFSDQISYPVGPGDIVVLEPAVFGGQLQVLPFKPSRQRQEETLAALWERIGSYPREKMVSFGRIVFLSAAREALMHHVETAVQNTDAVSNQWAQKLERLKVSWETELAAQQERLQGLASQLNSQRQYIARLEEEKAALREKVREADERCRLRLEAQTGQLEYLKRKLNQPARHEDIPAWAAEHFSGRLLVHPRAVGLLQEKSAQKVNVRLICDALDFLATDYWARRYEQITTEEMNTRCSQKYGRPFEVKPTGSTTVEFTPGQYKIKYFPGCQGKPVESPLDWHLGVGNDPENLLRIYFLHDDEKRLIVVGSLPTHLRAVKIRC